MEPRAKMVVVLGLKLVGLLLVGLESVVLLRQACKIAFENLH